MKVWGTRPDGAGRLDSSCALLAEAAPTLENEFRVSARASLVGKR